jgi:hypothetical protein
MRNVDRQGERAPAASSSARIVLSSVGGLQAYSFLRVIGNTAQRRARRRVWLQLDESNFRNV